MIKIKFADFVTLLNLVCGVAAIYFAIHARLTLAASLIIAGFIFDILDGKVARKLNQHSDFGIQIDSLADLATFGVAPVVLVWSIFPTLTWLAALSLLLPIAGTLRLARFNITTKSMPGIFIGAPISTNGILFPLLYFFGANAYVFAAAIVVVSCLMVSSIKIKKAH